MKARLHRADILIRRWAWLVKRGLPDIGYPHRSPEQALAGDYAVSNYIVMPEDDLTAEIINTMDLPRKRIIRFYWSQGLKESEIARRENLTRAKVRTRINWIKEQVANGVLM